MATQESLDRVQQLYVAYYGRPADQEGQEYWADRLDAEGEGAIINAFGNSEEYAAKAEGQGNATLINAIYQQAFNREADPEGLAYYAGVLERGEKTLAEIATTIINAAGGIDAQTFNARVEAAAAYTAEFGAAADYDLEAAIAAVEAAKPGVDASALTEALTTLSDAQTAEADFLEGLVSNEQFTDLLDELGLAEIDADSELADIRSAVSNAYSDTAENVEDALGEADGSFEDRSVTAQDQLIADGIEAAEKKVAEEEKDAETGVLNAIATVQARVTAYENTLEARDEAITAFEGEVARFEQVNGVDVTVEQAGLDWTVDFGTLPTTDGTTTYSVTVGGVEYSADYTVTGGTGTWGTFEDSNNTALTGASTAGSQLTFSTDAGVEVTSDDGTATSAESAVAEIMDLANLEAGAGLYVDGGLVATLNGNGQWVLEEGVDASDYNGADALLADGNALAGALSAAATAETALNNAADRVAELQGGSEDYTVNATENDGDYTVSVSFTEAALTDILNARQELKTLQDAVEAFELARGINTEADDLAEAITEARDAITDSEEDGGLGITLLEGAATFTAADDVYLFDAEEGNQTLGQFGVTGEDRIFFGDEYSLVQLDGAWKASADTGDAAALEIFWEQKGADLVLYTEEKAFAGNGSTDGDIVQITLSGVSANDVDFANGYLTAGEPA